jgi:L-fuconolactonase
MMRVDAHQHFWDPDTADYPWMTDGLAALRRKFAPRDLAPLLNEHGIDFSVLVQTRSSVDETREFLRLAAEYPFIAGVVGWVDLTDPDVSKALDDLRAEVGGDRLVGIRHQVHDEDDPDWIRREDVWRGLAGVCDSGLTYDLVIRPREMAATLATTRAFPDLRFIVDHIAKPNIREGQSDNWAEMVARLADCPNVWCKVSGMVTEADWKSWRPRDLAPYVAHVRSCFGVDRLIFGSDWPVCLVAAEYGEVVHALRKALGDIAEHEAARIFGANAVECYRLKVA